MLLDGKTGRWAKQSNSASSNEITCGVIYFSVLGLVAYERDTDACESQERFKGISLNFATFT